MSEMIEIPEHGDIEITSERKADSYLIRCTLVPTGRWLLVTVDDLLWLAKSAGASEQELDQR
ncbi:MULTISPECIES: hypothetical protein [unclassified Mesorhizobium]|uniref:hypothetical protein n=1 Tax=unclassified Mesorhizobium TaxID=325217 RepID=UPI000FDB9D58|nr:MULTISPECIES: hypothetical protein [unclassified Mesorhizobium]TGT76693.1 hypothetical protein EN809_003555 [Mesorhizobium sp. M2E.F.Ca.ET.166.01.1.1]TGW02805.1 hypothetical protein EN797_003555 [Mesorhizobium sp. M2E.F.Ca.ET.154.01.1.1]